MLIKTSPLLLVASITISTIIAGCKKDANGATSSIVGKWKITAYIHNGVDVFGTAIGTCVTDDITTFSSTNQVTNDEGPTKCDPSDPQTVTGTYSLSGDNKTLTLVVDGDTNINNVEVLNATTLKLVQQSNGDVVTFTRQP